MNSQETSKFDRAMTIILFALLISALTIVITSCGTMKGGCGGNPVHLGN